MPDITNETDAIKIAFGEYMNRWYDSIIPTTKQNEAFLARGFSNCVKWASGRMVDEAQKMLDSYRKNDNEGGVNNDSKLPVVLAAMSRDYTPVSGAWGEQAHEQYVVLEDAEDASFYRYRQSQFEVRVQVVFIGAESPTTRNLANSFCWFIGQPINRHFFSKYVWGQYELEMPNMIEDPDVILQAVDTEQKNLVMLAVDLMLKITVPHLKAPADGEETDNSGRNPEGYPVVQEVVTTHIKDIWPTGVRNESVTNTQTITESGVTNVENT